MKCAYACGREADKELRNGEKVCEQCFNKLRTTITEISKRINKKSMRNITALKCPACGGHTLKENKVENALSRYCSKYICNECGTREAMEGDFWHARAQFGTE